MRKHVQLAVVIVSAVFWSSLAVAQDIQRDWDREYDFSKLKTYSVKIGAGWGNQLSESRVSDDIAEALKDHGWKLVPEASADAIVVVNGATQTKRNATTFYDGYGGGYRYGGWGGSGTSTTMVSRYTCRHARGRHFDAKTKNLVFRGTATDELSNNREETRRAKKRAEDVRGVRRSPRNSGLRSANTQTF